MYILFLGRSFTFVRFIDVLGVRFMFITAEMSTKQN